jgi:PTH1 family peptidyl-tRNA hydrolase
MAQHVELIVGLGNPDPQYLMTRHNAGFWFADTVARAYGGRFTRNAKLAGHLTDVQIGGRRVRLLKPMTYMNESGQAVAATVGYFKIPLDKVLVAYDEIDLPLGRPRLKFGGGHAGHNGVRSIIERVGAGFWRLRIGVGHPGAGRRDRVVGHVLGRASADDETQILASIGEVLELLPTMIEQGPEKAQLLLHSPKPNAADSAEPDEDTGRSE